MQRVWDSGGRTEAQRRIICVMFYLSHTIRKPLRWYEWLLQDTTTWRHLIFLRMLHILYDSYESPNTIADFTVITFFFNLHWSIWFDYSQLMKHIPLHLAVESISHVMHINIKFASSLWSVSLQAPDTKHALLSPLENAAASKKCANCCLLIHLAFCISSI